MEQIFLGLYNEDTVIFFSYPAHGFDALAVALPAPGRQEITLFIPLETTGKTIGAADEKAGVFKDLHFQLDAAFLGIRQGCHGMESVVDHVGQKHGQVGIDNADVLGHLYRSLEGGVQFLGLQLTIGHQGVDEGMVGIPAGCTADLAGEMFHILLHPLEIPFLAKGR